METPELFAATYGPILRWLSEGKVHGVRIDHPDGLYDPQQYLEGLRHHYMLSMAHRVLDTHAAVQAVGEHELETQLCVALTQDNHIGGEDLQRPLYVVVEKILGVRESLREDWPVMAPVATTS